MKNKLILFVALTLTIASGVVRGHLDSRWGTSDEMAAAAERVRAIPSGMGEWQAADMSHLATDAVDMLRCDGDIVGHYENQASGQRASMVFITGPAGPLAQHVPEVCYGSNNYSVHTPTRQTTIVDATGQEHQFSVVTFTENGADEKLLRVYFSWNMGGDWIAPQNPRTHFAGVRQLYKVQVATSHMGEETPASVDAAKQFLVDNLPLLKPVYSPSAEKEKRTRMAPGA